MQPKHDPARISRCAFAIMAKAPRAGYSKTRLCPPLSHEEAAALSGAFLRDMADTVLAAAADAPIDLWVAYAPTGVEVPLRRYLPPEANLLLADGSGIDIAGVAGFGRPLLQALRALFDLGYGAAGVLNADSPNLPSALLAEAASHLLSGTDAVLGPAIDGGYYLLGLRAAHETLFKDIAWSTGTVAAETRTAAHAAGLGLRELSLWYDVDDEASLRRLIGDLKHAAAGTAQHTAGMLTSLAVRERLAIAARSPIGVV